MQFNLIQFVLLSFDSEIHVIVSVVRTIAPVVHMRRATISGGSIPASR